MHSLNVAGIVILLVITACYHSAVRPRLARSLTKGGAELSFIQKVVRSSTTARSLCSVPMGCPGQNNPR